MASCNWLSALPWQTPGSYLIFVSHPKQAALVTKSGPAICACRDRLRALPLGVCRLDPEDKCRSSLEIRHYHQDISVLEACKRLGVYACALTSSSTIGPAIFLPKIFQSQALNSLVWNSPDLSISRQSSLGSKPRDIADALSSSSDPILQALLCECCQCCCQVAALGLTTTCIEYMDSGP